MKDQEGVNYQKLVNAIVVATNHFKRSCRNPLMMHLLRGEATG